MNINAVNHANFHAAVHAPKEKHDEETETRNIVADETTEEITVPVENEEPETENAAEFEGETKGVIRNLLAGHYKGVADVRLRINFHDELTAYTQAQTQMTFEQQLPEMVAAISKEVESLLENDTFDDEILAEITAAKESFEQSIREYQQTINSDGATSFEDLSADLANLFNLLTEEMAAIFITPQPVTPEETIEPESEPVESDIQAVSAEAVDDIPVVDAEAEQFDIQEFIAGLKAVFENELEQLNAAVIEAGALPEIVPPTGNGVAFDKFMKILNNMESGNMAPPVETDVDTVA